MGPSRRVSGGARPSGLLLSPQELQKQRRHQQRSIASFFSPSRASKQTVTATHDSVPVTAAEDAQRFDKNDGSILDSPNGRARNCKASASSVANRNARRVLKSAVGGKGGGCRGSVVHADARRSNSEESKEDELLWTDDAAEEIKRLGDERGANPRKVALQIPPLADGQTNAGGDDVVALATEGHGGKTAVKAEEAAEGAAEENAQGEADVAGGEGSLSMASLGSDLSGSLLPAGRLRSLRRRPGGRSNVGGSQESGGELVEQATHGDARGDAVMHGGELAGEGVRGGGGGIRRDEIMKETSGKTATLPAGWSSKGTRGKGTRKRGREEANNEDGKGEEGARAVGRRVEVYWPDDAAWYAGMVAGYEEETGRHEVLYDDGESEMVVLAKEKVRWVRGAGGGVATTLGARKKEVGGRRGAEDAEAEAEGGEAGERGSGGGGGRGISKREKDGGERTAGKGRVVADEMGAKVVGSAVGKKVQAQGATGEKQHEEAAVESSDEDDDEDEEEEAEEDGDSEEEDWLEEVKRKGKKVEEEEDDDDEEEELEEEDEEGGSVDGTASDEEGEEEEEEEEMEDGRRGKKAGPGGGKKGTSPSGRGGGTAGEGKEKVAEGRKKGSQGEGGCEGLGGAAGGVTDAERSAIRKAMLGAGLLPELAGEAAQRFSGRMEAKFDFLFRNRRDGVRRPPSHPDYDPTTLFLPETFLKNLSEGQRQWWQFKAMHLDKVLLFKMGKFYELFEMDAHVGAKDLDLQYMKGDQPHCGFPEKNYAENAERLALKGYRVVVVEQVETPEQLEQRRRATGSKDKVVRRAVCAMVSRGTLVDAGMLSASPDSSLILALTEWPAAAAPAAAAAPVAAAAAAAAGSPAGEEREEREEREEEEGGAAAVVIGVAVVDAATGQFSLGQFPDDSARTRLCSLTAELRPVELVLPRVPASSHHSSSSSSADKPTAAAPSVPPSPCPSPATLRALSDACRQPLWNWRERIDDCWAPDATAAWLQRFYAPEREGGGGAGEGRDCGEEVEEEVEEEEEEEEGSGERRRGGMPRVIAQLIAAGAAGGAAGGAGSAGSTAVLSALGGLLAYLRACLLESRLLALRRFSFLPAALPPGCGRKTNAATAGKGRAQMWGQRSDPMQVEGQEVEEAEGEWEEDEQEEEEEEEPEEEPFMVLDSCALENLEILENSRDGTSSGSLFALLDRTVTPFGRRLLRQWLVRPLLRAEAIRERQRAVGDLMGVGAEAAGKAVKALGGVADLDRLLPRIHSHWAKAFPAAAEAKAGKHHQHQQQQQQMGRNASQVVLYENVALARVREFTSALRGCQALLAAAQAFAPLLPRLSSSLLRNLLSPAAPGGGEGGGRGGGGGAGRGGGKEGGARGVGKGTFPPIESRLRAFERAFDWAQADACGRILPSSPGVDAAYDSAAVRVKAVEAELQQHREEQRHVLRAPPTVRVLLSGLWAGLIQVPLAYVTVGKDPFQLEVPDSLLSRVPPSYELKSQKKGMRRFWTPFIRSALQRLAEAKEEEEAALKGIYQLLLGRFCASLPLWLHFPPALSHSPTHSLTHSLSLLISTHFHAPLPSRQGVRRFWTPFIRSALQRLSEAKEEEEAALKGIYQRLLGRFCASLPLWLRAVHAIAQLDALLSLAAFSRAGAPPMCRPHVGFDVGRGEEREAEGRGRGNREWGLGKVPYFRAKGLRHAVLATMGSGGSCFVPNDTVLGGCDAGGSGAGGGGGGGGRGGEEGKGGGAGGGGGGGGRGGEGARMMLLTGPNMGGKSTLIRQTCLAVILAQLGAHVPAESLSLSPVDRVFVRMGARDHIMAARSTFLVELQETAGMLRCATRHSFVALDELGRGTATSDGHAIAHAVFEHLLNRVGCVGVFSTHYHALAHDFQHHPGVSLQHMACQVRSSPPHEASATAAAPLETGCSLLPALSSDIPSLPFHCPPPPPFLLLFSSLLNYLPVPLCMLLSLPFSPYFLPLWWFPIVGCAGMPESVLCCAGRRAQQLEQEREAHRRERLAAAALAEEDEAVKGSEGSAPVEMEGMAVHAVLSQVHRLLREAGGKQQGMDESAGTAAGMAVDCETGGDVLAKLRLLQARIAEREG
ncbi:unnamed protein product [Closterium sp. Naga37s-1]|nr:unnamed protein product [Closterium sp. Naga37s-1]